MPTCLQGGTCIVIGDEHAKVTEAAKLAERHLKCTTFRSSPFWRKEGFSQDVHAKEVRRVCRHAARQPVLGLAVAIQVRGAAPLMRAPDGACCRALTSSAEALSSCWRTWS